jgi:catalase
MCPVMNNQRDGFMRYAISKSPVNYWPNRLNHIPPTPEAKGAFINFEQKVAGIKQRLNAPKFKEYYNQATLFLNSLARISPPSLSKFSTRIRPHGRRHLLRIE